jgi:hypothetical protein
VLQIADFVTTDDGEASCDASMCHWNSGSAWTGDCARDARNDFDRNTGFYAGKDFFGAAAEHVWIATFEARYPQPTARPFDNHSVDLVLSQYVIIWRLAGIDELNTSIKIFEQFKRCESIEDDNICIKQSLAAAHSDEVGSPWASADEHHAASRAFALTAGAHFASPKQPRHRIAQKNTSARIA